MKKIISFTIVAISVINLNAQTVLFNEDFSSGIPADWTVIDEDGNIPNAAVIEFNAAWIPFITGSDTCVASTSYYEPTAQASDYLISPLISIGNFSKLVWDARSVDASFPDSYTVLISTTDNNLESFTDTLHIQAGEDFAWHKRSVVLDEKGYANQDIYIAFKNFTNNGFILLMDNIQVLGSEFAGLDNEIEALNVNIFPNPSSDYIQIRGQEDNLIETTLFSTNGQLILQTTAEKIDISALKKGVYFIRMRTGLHSKTVQLIKN